MFHQHGGISQQQPLRVRLAPATLATGLYQEEKLDPGRTSPLCTPAGVSGSGVILRIEAAPRSMRWPLPAGLTAPAPSIDKGNDRDVRCSHAA